MANFAKSPFHAGESVQVNVAGLLDLGDSAGRVAGVSACIAQIDPVTQLITVVLDAPVGGQHSLIVPISRVQPANAH